MDYLITLCSAPILGISGKNICSKHSIGILKLYLLTFHFRSHEQILVSGPCILFELIGENSVQVLKELAGPTNPDIARKEAPTTIRGLFGKDTLHNVLHAAESFEAAGKVCNLTPYRSI